MDKLQPKHGNKNLLSYNNSKQIIKIDDTFAAPSLNKLIKENNVEAVQMTIEAVILKSMKRFNVKFSMNNVQVEFFAEEFINEFEHETIDDLILCLKSAARGEYGEIYNAIDPPLLFGWLKKHLDYKAIVREALQRRKKTTMQKQSDESPVNNELNKLMSQKIREELRERKEKEPTRGEGLGERLKKQQGL